MYALETKKLMRLPGILFVVTEYALTITNCFFLLCWLYYLLVFLDVILATDTLIRQVNSKQTNKITKLYHRIYHH